MLCPNCGEKNPAGAKFCSKCGAALTAKAEKAPARRAAPAAGERTSGMAVASLVLGIVGFFFLGFLSILAIIFGAIGLSQTGKDPSLKGRGMATAGLVLGIIGILGGIIWAIIAALFSMTFWWWI
jgi:uncharacterized membrane protein YvbJ